MASIHFREAVQRWWREANTPNPAYGPPPPPPNPTKAVSDALLKKQAALDAERIRIHLEDLRDPDRNKDLKPKILHFRTHGRRGTRDFWQCFGQGKHGHISGIGKTPSHAFLVYLHNKANWIATYGPY